MKRNICLAIGLLLSCMASAQKLKDVFRVKEGTDISKTFPYSEQFQFSSFRDGKVFFRNGRTSKAKFNYSYIHAEVQFISPEQDTMLFADNRFIDKILIGDDLFYYVEHHGHVQQIGDFGNEKLGKKQFLVIMGNEKYAAYEQYSSTSAITSYSSIVNIDGSLQMLQGNQHIVLKRRSIYFFIDQNRRFYAANKANLLKIARDRKKEVNTYLKENEIDFEKEEDLMKVLNFTSSLSRQI